MITDLNTPPWETPSRALDGHSLRFPFTDGGGRSLRRLHPRTERPEPTGLEAGSGLTRRGLVYEYIRAHPGCHIRLMARELGFGTGNLQYHLFWLEKNGYIKTKKSGFYRFVYPTMVFQESQEAILGALSQETPREILLCLLEYPTITQGDLARRLGHSQPTISWHMDRLVGLGIVSKKRASRGVGYEIDADPVEVLGFVRRYHPEAWTRWSDRPRGVAVSERPATVELIGQS